MELVRNYKNSKKIYPIAKKSRKYLNELHIEEQEELNKKPAPEKAAN